MFVALTVLEKIFVHCLKKKSKFMALMLLKKISFHCSYKNKILALILLKINILEKIQIDALAVHRYIEDRIKYIEYLMEEGHLQVFHKK